MGTGGDCGWGPGFGGRGNAWARTSNHCNRNTRKEGRARKSAVTTEEQGNVRFDLLRREGQMKGVSGGVGKRAGRD